MEGQDLHKIVVECFPIPGWEFILSAQTGTDDWSRFVRHIARIQS